MTRRLAARSRRSSIVIAGNYKVFSSCQNPAGSNLSRAATVGIDFGTTNTSAYMKIEADKGIPMAFADRIVSPIVAAGSSPSW